MISETVGCHSLKPPTTGKIRSKKGTSELSFHKKKMEATSENEAKLKGLTNMVHTHIFILRPGHQKHKDRGFSYLSGWVFFFVRSGRVVLMGKQMGMLTGAPPKQPVSIFMTLHQRQDGRGCADDGARSRLLSLAVSHSLPQKRLDAGAQTAAHSRLIQSLEGIKLKKMFFSQILLNSD